MRLLKAAAAAIILVGLVVVPPWALMRFIGNPWPAEGLSWSAPLTDGAIIGLLAVVVWVLWAQLMVCVLVEATAVVTADRVQLPAPFTLGVQQQLARRLLTAIVVATVSTPVALVAADVAAHGDTGPDEPARRATGAASTDARSNPWAAAGTHTSAGSQTARAERLGGDRRPDAPAGRVTVMRLDSLWSIAERVLGEGDRWPEIADLNEGRVMNDGTRFAAADHIRPGWELLVPGAPAGRAAAEVLPEVVVEKGDTLSQIALEELGDANAYPRLVESTADVVQPGGARLTDPDLILPGWTIPIPGQRPAVDDHERAPETQQRSRARREPAHGTTEPTPFSPAESLPDPRTVDEPPSTGTTAAQAAGEEQDDDGFSLLRALLASGLCLSAGALALVAGNRRRQFRQRRPGCTIASTPAELVGVEQAVVEHGRQAQDDVEFLDRALRHAAAWCRANRAALPQLGAAVLGQQELTLLFAEPAAGVPVGWNATEDARAWTLSRLTFLEDELLTQPAPYPALVTIGQDEGDRTWLLDLELLGVVGMAGPAEQVADLTRFLVAELAVNGWAEGTEVLLAGGFGAELVPLNPARLRQVDRETAMTRAAALTSDATASEHNLGADLLTRRRNDHLLDSTGPVVVVVPGRADADLVEVLQRRDRSRVVVIHGDDSSPALELRDDGRAFLPRWGISVQALTLPQAEADAMAALVASTRNTADEPMPVTAEETGPLGGYAKADGSLRDELTEPRRTDEHDASSVLPAPDVVYLATAATTPENLAALGPSVPESTRAELAAIDPTLDQDLADWFDSTSIRPKVHLLGPVDVTAVAGTREGISNLAGTIELIVYLACCERGVTGERAAEACGWKTVKTVQNRAIDARRLLGTRPDGSDWLPDAGKTESARRGVPTYELDKGPGGVLVDADLLVRLKFRAHKRGDDSLEDLVTALSLVQGEPFDDLRRGGYGWLFEGQRHDQILVAAIHDTAHVLATRAVAEGRTDLVRQACEAARRANPHSDVAWLDLAAAAEADSGRAAADELVRSRILDRVDEDLPPRTEAVIDRRGWLTG
ncbi:LysM peptidoglycan-binding domain-containing protein [Nocardioides gansuensis]|nr:LysM peptidoglycan-binding domain-containing protein [Nocardioides gansuensis]